MLKKAADLPQSSGVYLFKNSKAKIIYVGKAKNLRDRVKSYFSLDFAMGTKTQALVERTSELDFIETQSELEALILEAELIRRHRPKYNISLKDDKSCLYIVISKEKVEVAGKKVSLSKVLTSRKSDLKKSDVVFGPFSEAATAKFVVRAIRKIIPYRDCKRTKFSRQQKLMRPCLYGDLGLCQAPCTGAVSPKEYQKDMSRIKKLLLGESQKVLKALEREMKFLSKRQSFEEAARKRDTIGKFRCITQSFKDVQKYVENPYLVEDLLQKALEDLTEKIFILDKIPRRIECYDISDISGKEATGSMVVAVNGRIVKGKYKKFKIRAEGQPDDFEMLREVIRRRFKEKSRKDLKRKAKRGWAKPDLIVVDGGRGQVSAVLSALDEGGLKLPVAGLAKKEEVVVFRKDSGDFVELKLDRSNEGLKLLQRLRDESHRFAKSYHHYLRMKKLKEC